MKKPKWQIIIGISLIITPFIGVPQKWQHFFVVLVGMVIVWQALKEYQLRLKGHLQNNNKQTLTQPSLFKTTEESFALNRNTVEKQNLENDLTLPNNTLTNDNTDDSVDITKKWFQSSILLMAYHIKQKNQTESINKPSWSEIVSDPRSSNDKYNIQLGKKTPPPKPTEVLENEPRQTVYEDHEEVEVIVDESLSEEEEVQTKLMQTKAKDYSKKSLKKNESSLKESQTNNTQQDLKYAEDQSESIDEFLFHSEPILDEDLLAKIGDDITEEEE